ncbi:extracellular solute-binding protein [Ochrobactrum sp. SFR4]|uniref:extracellular solute-binding protein n=1 Tax=Ochrobactrum sp. SFR4 TaxID=2717368 RepID=UPI0025711B0C|nr:extracellular solute-binding protein [Ochrobactrum sp. SFR4]MBX8825785.1 ABC transporter substrate-binding protein [Ochrobactrum sp. SFR4]
MAEGMINRRKLMILGGAATFSAALPLRAKAQDGAKTAVHGLAVFDDLKYPAGFSHFDYINPQAPKGGSFNFSVNEWTLNQAPDTFNTLNTFSALGDAPPRMESCFDSLMTRSLDEADAVYGLLAESVTVSDDGTSYIFKLREQARFHDNTPVTAHDAAFSYNLLKEKGHPALRLLLAKMESAVADDDYHLRLTLKGENAGQNRRLIISMATLPVLSKAYYTEHKFDGNSLNIPLSSGAYKVGALSAGQYIEYQRNEDYWAKDLNVNIGCNNFDRIRIEFFRDRQPAFEAFKKGILDWRAESVAKSWANDYDFTAVQSGKIIRNRFPAWKIPSMQSWALNQRRERFRDPRVREAIGLCFDFEWSNRNLFSDLYQRQQSSFSNSAFEAQGKASPEEQAVITRHAGLMDNAARTALLDDPVTMPVTDGSGRNREQLRRAAELMKAAGYQRKGQWLIDQSGQVFTLEILNNSDGFNRVYNPMIKNLQAIGINAEVRMAEAATYQKRLLDFDYDMIGFASSSSATPDRAALAIMYGSESVSLPGSQNYTGTSSPLIDALLDDVAQADNRDNMTAIIRVLDRLLRYRRDWIPCWSAGGKLIAYWDKFGMTDSPPYGGYPEFYWWYDHEKAAQLGKT